jgi:hypothetical protein
MGLNYSKNLAVKYIRTVWKELNKYKFKAVSLSSSGEVPFRNEIQHPHRAINHKVKHNPLSDMMEW